MVIPFLDSFFLSCLFCLLLSFVAPLVLSLFQALPVWELLLLALSDLSRPGWDTNQRWVSGSGWVTDVILGSDKELLVSGMQEKGRVTDFVSQIKRVENYPDWKTGTRNLTWSLRFLQKNTEDVSTEPSNLITFCISGTVAILSTKLNQNRGIWSRCTAKERAQKTQNQLVRQTSNM